MEQNLPNPPKLIRTDTKYERPPKETESTEVKAKKEHFCGHCYVYFECKSPNTNSCDCYTFLISDGADMSKLIYYCSMLCVEESQKELQDRWGWGTE